MEGSASETSPAKRAGMVLVAGAGGFLGQGITAALVSEGWQVRGLLRTPAKTDLVRRIGAEPFLGDVLDPASLRRCVEGCDAVIHVAAAYPGPGVSPELARKVRVEGTRNLASAARSAGARRLLVGSGYWVYADQPGVLEDDSSLDPRGESQVNYEAERAGLESAVPRELEVVVVRPGMVYGDGSWFRGMVDSIWNGSYRYPDPGENHWSLVELGDAARAFATLLERGKAGGAYLVVDDAPISLRDLSALIAREVHAAAPRGVSRESVEEEVGPDVARHLAANRAGSNRKLRELGWVPRNPDSRQGIPALLRSMRWGDGRDPREYSSS